MLVLLFHKFSKQYFNRLSVFDIARQMFFNFVEMFQKKKKKHRVYKMFEVICLSFFNSHYKHKTIDINHDDLRK